jgi:uncharacterized protein (DUF1778 family)
MPRVAVQDSGRLSLRIRAEEKALLVRAAAHTQTDLTTFVLRNAVEAARVVIAAAARTALSEQDSLRALAALEDPPLPNDKLLAAAHALPQLP